MRVKAEHERLIAGHLGGLQCGVEIQLRGARTGATIKICGLVGRYFRNIRMLLLLLLLCNGVLGFRMYFRENNITRGWLEVGWAGSDWFLCCLLVARAHANRKPALPVAGVRERQGGKRKVF